MDLSTEHQAWDNTELVYWEISRGSAIEARNQVSQIDVIPIAKRRALRKSELAASGGAYLASDLIWHLPVSILTPGLSPKLGDVLIDQDQIRYTIFDLTLGRFKQRWQCTTRNLSLVFGLTDLITIQTATNAADKSGALIQLWPPDGGQTTYPNLTCKVQLTGQNTVAERGLRGKQSTYDITVDRQINISTEDRILWGSKILDVVGYRQAESIVDLPVIEAVLRP